MSCCLCLVLKVSGDPDVIVRWRRDQLRVLVLFCKLWGGRWRSGGLVDDRSRLHLLCFDLLGEDGVHILLLGYTHDIIIITTWSWWYLKTCADRWHQPATAQVLHYITKTTCSRGLQQAITQESFPNWHWFTVHLLHLCRWMLLR